MKRNFILVCISALVLALGLSATAGAKVGAEISAKSAKKGKACKGKAGKKAGKHKAGKSTAAAARAKKKAKGKSCKAKNKSKSKGKDKGKGQGASPSPVPPPVAPPAAIPFGDGTYGDAALQLNVSGGGTSVVLKYVPPGGCVSINYTSQPVTLTKNGDTWTASETRAFSIGGEPANAKWDLTVKEPGLTYALNFTLESKTMIGPCKWEGHPTGTLAKVG